MHMFHYGNQWDLKLLNSPQLNILPAQYTVHWIYPDQCLQVVQPVVYSIHLKICHVFIFHIESVNSLSNEGCKDMNIKKSCWYLHGSILLQKCLLQKLFSLDLCHLFYYVEASSVSTFQIIDFCHKCLGKPVCCRFWLITIKSVL